MIWLLEIVILLVFVGFGGFEGFIAWAVISALILFARHSYAQTQLKAAEVVLRAEKEQLAERERVAERERRAEKERRAQMSRQARLRVEAQVALERERRAEQIEARSPGAPAGALARASTPEACGKCGARNDADADFCKRCGVRMDHPLVCACGNTNDLDAAFCKRCGADLSKAPATREPGPPAVVAEEPDHPAAPIVRLKVCPDCGEKNKGEAYQCSKCRHLFRSA